MRHAARAIVIKDNSLLVIHRHKRGQEYYTLPGGGIESGETPEQAALRELAEETGVSVTLDRLVFTEAPHLHFGAQYIFLCHYSSGEPALHPDSEEAASNRTGDNLYSPEWLPLHDLAQVTFVSPRLHAAIRRAVTNGFPLAAETL